VGNTHWELVAIAEEPVAAAGQKPAFFRLNLDNGRVLGFGGCNGFFGSVTSEGSTLTFSKVGATLMACQDGMETEKAFMSVLDSTTEYDLTGSTLILRANDRDLATFKTRYFK
jgi:heat shock protein HslJ